jgi:glutamyl-tRNA reductase
VRHLFRVATGLDSMVLGEPQILGQVKEAWQAARAAAASAIRSTGCSSKGFAVAKRVRTDTRIGAHPVSVAYAAVRLARQVFARLDEASVLWSAPATPSNWPRATSPTPRCAACWSPTARSSTRRCWRRGTAAWRCRWPSSTATSPMPDIVISATASRLPVLQRAQVAAALKARRQRPMFLLDLAVPRDIAPDVATLPTSTCTPWTTSSR